MAKQTFTVGQVLTAAQMTSLQQTAMGGGSTTAKTASYTLVAADAGTVVQMNSASATTITVNTALFVAGDTVQIQNIGVGVCTVTAGTATVSTAGLLALSQYEGGQLYFNTTSAALFFDLVQASGSTSGLTLIQRSSFSNVAGTSTTFDGVFTSTYKTYLAVIETIVGTTYADDLQLQFRYAGPNTQTTAYYGSSITTDYSIATVANTQTNNAAEATLNLFIGTDVQAPTSGYIYFQNVGNASEKPYYTGSLMNADSFNLNVLGGANNTARTYTGFLLKSSSTNVTGTVAVYGLATA